MRRFVIALISPPSQSAPAPARVAGPAVRAAPLPVANLAPTAAPPAPKPAPVPQATRVEPAPPTAPPSRPQRPASATQTDQAEPGGPASLPEQPSPANGKTSGACRIRGRSHRPAEEGRRGRTRKHAMADESLKRRRRTELNEPSGFTRIAFLRAGGDQEDRAPLRLFSRTVKKGNPFGRFDRWSYQRKHVEQSAGVALDPQR